MLPARVALLLLAAFHAVSSQDIAGEIKPLMEAGNSAHMKGDYEAARQSLVQAWDLAQQTMPADPVRYDILKRLTSVRAAAGEFAEADNYLQMAINWRETTLGPNDPKIADDLLISVALCRGMEKYDRALVILNRVMSMHRAIFGLESVAIADDYSRMAQVYMEMGQLPSVVSFLNLALSFRTKAVGPLDPTLVPELDRLAGALLSMRAYDKAEAAFRQALVIRETLLGRNDADLIATVDGLAYACFGQKKYAEAEPLYQRLIDLWTKSLGAEHPMVAMALDKVAVFYADQKKFDQVKEAADRGIAIRTHFLASALSTAATEQSAEGHKEDALALYKRARAVMDPPHPMYEEMRLQVENILKGSEPPATAAPKKAAPKKK